MDPNSSLDNNFLNQLVIDLEIINNSYLNGYRGTSRVR